MSDKDQKAAIITGGSQGIGASLATAYQRRGWSVAATTRAMKPAKDPDVLTVDGDLADPATADRIISGEVGHCGCIEALVNNADVYISKRAIHRAVIPAAPQNLQIWAVATTSESTDHMGTESAGRMWVSAPALPPRFRLVGGIGSEAWVPA
jgi:NAD(P)-dependent dehydrogenase (short-subunit alcohol dehydrogenase family)